MGTEDRRGKRNEERNEKLGDDGSNGPGEKE